MSRIATATERLNPGPDGATLPRRRKHCQGASTGMLLLQKMSWGLLRESFILSFVRTLCGRFGGSKRGRATQVRHASGLAVAGASRSAKVSRAQGRAPA
jgi:hypothetical protein